MCKTSCPLLGILVRVFSIHQILKKVLKPNYWRITALRFKKQSHLIILFYYTTMLCEGLHHNPYFTEGENVKLRKTAQVLYKKVFSLQMSVLATCCVSACVPLGVERKKQRWNVKVDSTFLVGCWLSFQLKSQRMGPCLLPPPTSHLCFHSKELPDRSRLWFLAQALMHCPTQQNSLRTRDEM